MPKPMEIGEQFGRLTVIELVPRSRKNKTPAKARCRCTCGNEVVAVRGDIKFGKTISCGCAKKEHAAELGRRDKRGSKNPKYKGAISYDPLYGTWKGMVARCTNPIATGYRHYGGRGIRVDKRWVDSFLSFKLYVVNTLGPKLDGHTLDRKNNAGHYEPGNLRWASHTEQMLNRRKMGSITSFTTEELEAEITRRRAIGVA